MTRWTAPHSAEDNSLLHLTMLDTVELEKEIEACIASVQENLRLYATSADARKSYMLTQFMTSPYPNIFTGG